MPQFDYTKARDSGLTDQQIFGHLSEQKAKGINITLDRSEVENYGKAPKQTGGFLDRLKADELQRGQDIGASQDRYTNAKGFGNKVSQGIQGTFQAAGSLIGGAIVDPLKEVGASVASRLSDHHAPTPDSYYNPTFLAARNRIQQDMQKAQTQHAAEAKVHPAMAADVKAFGDIASAYGSLEGGAALGKAAVQGGKSVAGRVVANTGKAMQATGERSIKQAWSLPARQSTPGFKKAAEIYKNQSQYGHDISETLLKNKIDPKTIVDGKNYSTLDHVEAIKSDAAKMSHDVLRPSLEAANMSVQRVPVQDVIRSAVRNVTKSKAVQETKDILIKNIRALGEENGALSTQFPDGLQLTDLHDEKILRDAGAKYNALSDTAQTHEALKNKALADALRTTLERKAPPEIPVRAFNRQLTKQHKAAAYLESINGKKVPQSFASKFRGLAGKAGGAAVAHSFGGGLFADVVGYQIGGMLEGTLEGLPNPIKSWALKNLKDSNPEAFKKVTQYMSDAEKRKLTTPLLTGTVQGETPRVIPLGLKPDPVKPDTSGIVKNPRPDQLPNVVRDWSSGGLNPKPKYIQNAIDYANSGHSFKKAASRYGLSLKEFVRIMADEKTNPLTKE